MENLDKRSIDILTRVIEAYVETGEPVGSRILSKQIGLNLSAATIRNVMADLENIGLLSSLHVSSGRVPTEKGLKFFVEGILEIGDLDGSEKEKIESQANLNGQNLDTILQTLTGTLSGLSDCAGLVIAPKLENELKQIEFISLGSGRILVVLVTIDGSVENRIMETNLPNLDLAELNNFLRYIVVGKTLHQIIEQLKSEIAQNKGALKSITNRLIEQGLIVDSSNTSNMLIVKGQVNLLKSLDHNLDLEIVKKLFLELEKQDLANELLNLVGNSQGVKIYIGADNPLFQLSGCSMILSSFNNHNGRILGMIGVIGPTRMNYSKVIPLVDYTAKIIEKVFSSNRQ